mgnify:CR=1 FL=1
MQAGLCIAELASEPNPITPAFDSAKFRVTRRGDLSRSLLVHYRVSGTASNGVDYQLLSGTTNIADGAFGVDVPIVTINDALADLQAGRVIKPVLLMQ